MHEKNNTQNLEKEIKFGLDQKEVIEEFFTKYDEETEGLSREERNSRFKEILYNITKRFCRRYDKNLSKEEFPELMGMLGKIINNRSSYFTEETKEKVSKNLTIIPPEQITNSLSNPEKKKLHELFTSPYLDIKEFFQDIEYQLQQGENLYRSILSLLKRHNILTDYYSRSNAAIGLLNIIEKSGININNTEETVKYFKSVKKLFKDKEEKQLNLPVGFEEGKH